MFGIHLSYVCRNATTQFQERRFLCLAIVVEATVSGAFYVLRIIYSKSLHPDYSFLAYFTRSQLTTTVVLLVIFTPKARFVICSDATHWLHFSTCSFSINPYPTAFPYGNGMVLHFYQQQESSTTKTVHKVINKGLKTYV